MAIAIAFVQYNNNTTVCRILNYNPHTVTMKRGTKLARLENLNVITAIEVCKQPQDPEAEEKTTERRSKAKLDQFHQEYCFQINSTLTEEKRLELLQLLFRYKHTFARSLEEIKVCKGTPMNIYLNFNCKVFKRQFRLNESDKTR